MSPFRAWLVAAALSGAATCAAAGWAGPSQPVRFAPERDYGPFVFQREDGRIDGLSVEMLGLLQERASLNVHTLPARPLKEQLEALRRREADLVSSLRATPERGEYALFTLPYVSVPAVVVMRADRPERRLAALTGEPVAVGLGYAVEPVMRRRYPTVAWQGVSDDAVALRGVLHRRFEAAVVDAASFAHVVATQRLDGLRVVAPADFEYALSFAVRKDWPELREALDDAIRSLPGAQRQAVLRRWLAEPPPLQRTPWATWLGVALLLAGLLMALAAAGRGLRRRSGQGD
ncbi:MAG: transporter substrate-binding domain-containing protein [Piscinibacter sp.]|uniref:transporter substrate-binding domain-containing protein n=1 Tax=Piscinibacter sp. TaxID=1903157 RepID=UPI003D0FADD6